MTALALRSYFFRKDNGVVLGLFPAVGSEPWHHLVLFIVLVVLLVKLLPPKGDWPVYAWCITFLIGLWVFGGYWPVIRVIVIVELLFMVCWYFMLGKRPPGGN